MNTRPGLRTTHTVAELEVSFAAYDEIASKLAAAGYGHVFDSSGPLIDMTGIGLVPADGLAPTSRTIRPEPAGYREAVGGGSESGHRRMMAGYPAPADVALEVDWTKAFPDLELCTCGTVCHPIATAAICRRAAGAAGAPKHAGYDPARAGVVSSPLGDRRPDQEREDRQRQDKRRNTVAGLIFVGTVVLVLIAVALWRSPELRGGVADFFGVGVIRTK